LTAYHDVKHIEVLAKSNMLEFVNQNIHPSSSTRAKVSVHLIAQMSAAASARAEKRDDADGANPEASLMRAEQRVAAVSAHDSSVSSTKIPVRIENVKAWKAGLQLSTAVIPVKRLSAFEDPT
jgi:insulysin